MSSDNGSPIGTNRAAKLHWAHRGAIVVAAALIGVGLQACGTSQVAVPAGPGGASPTAQPSSSSSPSAGGQTKAVPTKPVRPHGNIRQHAKTHSVRVEAKQSVTKTSSFSDGVKVSIVKLAPVTAEAIGPGQVGGPAVAATLKITNGSTDPIDLTTVSVRLLGSDGSPGIMTTGGEAAPLSGDLAVGASSRGTYVFTVAKSLRKPVTVQVEYGNGQTVLQFSGNAA